ncbi:hypothetical protein KIM372_07910 [Bombiscardovia nodaiensis]|uniref:Peptidase S24/S26A/S26B/S26C domain-containing protein n=1 Tax=Bombiscardovia nodaiensis TaxID=2932181 RepID=A0ABM8B7N1_9BIFI|nr:hypothetical protein KIM372_07910 [Bombiscardovia nodaiensis]
MLLSRPVTQPTDAAADGRSPAASGVRCICSVKLNPQRVPIALEAVHAGFPSVAQDYFSGEFSFDEHVIVHPNSTYIVHVAGDSMTGAGIFDGDVLVVDRSLNPCDGDVVIAILDNELTVKRLRCQQGRSWLHAENPAYPDFWPAEGEELVVWGVVTGNYHWQRADSSTQLEDTPAPNVSYPHPGLSSTPTHSNRRAKSSPPQSESEHAEPRHPQRGNTVYPSSPWEHYV